VVATAQPTSPSAVEIAPAGITFEDYLEKYAGDFYEWVGGAAVKLPVIDGRHDGLIQYLVTFFATYFELRPVGAIRVVGFVMKLTTTAREPDLMIILHTNPGQLTPTYMDGPADIVIEIVSPESVQRDHGEKFAEYEKCKVPEYWIVDSIHEETRFYRLGDNGLYARQSDDAEGRYRTPALPGLVLDVPPLWQADLPGPLAIGSAVQEMLR
jgi:Uma2 family endonuclease